MNERSNRKPRRRKKQAPKNTAGLKQRHDHPKKPAPATKKAKKESSGPRPSKFEIPPEIKTAWAEINHPLVQAQTELFIKELKAEKKVDLEVASMGAIMPEEVRPELDRINRELFEEAVEAMFLAYKYERKVRKKQETPEFLWAVFLKGLAPFIRQRKDIARPLLEHWLSRITVEAAGLEHEAESQPPIAPPVSGLVPTMVPKVPITLEALKSKRSCTAAEAASALDVNPRMIRNLARNGKLTRTAAGRITCDQKLFDELNRRHSPQKP